MRHYAGRDGGEYPKLSKVPFGRLGGGGGGVFGSWLVVGGSWSGRLDHQPPPINHQPIRPSTTVHQPPTNLIRRVGVGSRHPLESGLRGAQG